MKAIRIEDIPRFICNYCRIQDRKEWWSFRAADYKSYRSEAILELAASFSKEHPECELTPVSWGTRKGGFVLNPELVERIKTADDIDNIFYDGFIHKYHEFKRRNKIRLRYGVSFSIPYADLRCYFKPGTYIDYNIRCIREGIVLRPTAKLIKGEPDFYVASKDLCHSLRPDSSYLDKYTPEQQEFLKTRVTPEIYEKMIKEHLLYPADDLDACGKTLDQIIGRAA